MGNYTTHNRGFQLGHPELLTERSGSGQTRSYGVWLIAMRFLSLLMILLLIPLFLTLWVAMKLTSPGPFLFTQMRPGRNGRHFKIYKIRTMHLGSEKGTALGTQNTSPQVTKLGRWLRALKIDELPQLINILKGEMSFVGPRPIPVALDQHLQKKISGFSHRYTVRPGLTSVGQICIHDNALNEELEEDWEVRFEGELHYIRSQSVRYDIIILIMTFAYVVRKTLGLGAKTSAE